MTGHDPQAAGWRVLDQRTLVDRRPWYRIDEQRVELPDGRVIDGYAQMRLRDYAIVVALTEDDHLLVERMYKHGPGRVVLDLVAGLVEDTEQPADAAKRELREETGSWRQLTSSCRASSNYFLRPQRLRSPTLIERGARRTRAAREGMPAGLLTEPMPWDRHLQE